jgi:4-amino-4-deoxy-L-arabinose transferase-like glycosyltransferase
MAGTATSSRTDPVLRGLVLLAAAIRLGYWLSKWNQALLLNDSFYYSIQAHQLAHGEFFRELFVDQPGAEHGPLTSTLMAPFSFAADYVRWQRLVTVICGVTLVWLIGRLGRRLGGRTAGLLAAAVAAVYPNLWLNDGLVMSESVSMLLIAAIIWFALDAAERMGWRANVPLGVALGLATLARSELLLLVPLVLCWLAAGHRRRGKRIAPAIASVAAVAALVLTPWIGFNVARFERPVLLTTNDGTTWLGANCDESYNGSGTGGWNLICVISEPQFSADEEPSVRSARLRSLALDYARAHAADIPRVMLARVGRTLDVYGVRDLIRADVGEERPRLWAWAGVPAFWLLALTSPWGARRLARRERWLLLLPVATVLFTTVVFYGGHRIRSTAEPTLVLLAALAAAPLIERLLIERQGRA